MSIPASYDTLLSCLCHVLPDVRLTQVRNLALGVWGVLRARHCALGRVADELPLEGTKAGRLRRLKRWGTNRRIGGDTLYGPLVRLALSRWHLTELTLVWDRTEGTGVNIVMVGGALLGRVLPLGWTVLDHDGHANFEAQKALGERVRPWLPGAPRKALAGDGEFKSVELRRYAQALGWDFRLGQSADTLLQLPSGTWGQLGDLRVPKTRPLYLSGVVLPRQHAFGPVNLIAYGDREKQEQRYGATSRPAPGRTFAWGRQRSWIEGLLRDDKSGGFDLEATHLQHADRLHRLLLVLAMGYLGCFHVGRWVFKTGQRRTVDAAKHRPLSYFRLG